MGTLDGRVAFVTGAGNGIGATAATTLAARGATVMVTDVDGDAAETVALSIREAGGKAAAATLDVTNRAQMESAVERTVSEFGRVDILVALAGIIRDNLLFRMTDSEWKSVMDTHLYGSFLAAQTTQKYMVPQRCGKMVFTSSISALGNKGQANYAAAKMGMQGLTRTLAMELGPFNINVNCVAPGFIDTRMTRAISERTGVDFEQIKAQYAAETPLRRIGQPEDIANVIAFLVSEDASYVSGQTIYVAGGPRG